MRGFSISGSASTANTYASALSYCHRLAGMHNPTEVFWVLEMLKGHGKLGSNIHSCLLITISILQTILQQTSLVSSTENLALLCKAMCTAAFLAFLPVGEITSFPGSPAMLQLSQVIKLVEIGVTLPV